MSQFFVNCNTLVLHSRPRAASHMRKASFAMHDTETWSWFDLAYERYDTICSIGHNVEESSGVQEGGVCSTGATLTRDGCR